MSGLAGDLAITLGGEVAREEVYARFFLESPGTAVALDLIEISHPYFSKTYRLVRNCTAGITVTLEDGSQATFDYLPMRIESLGARDTLDYGIRVDLGDLGEIIPKELDRLGGYELTPWEFWYDSSDTLALILAGLSQLVNEDLPAEVGVPFVVAFGVGAPDGLSVAIQAIRVVGSVTGYMVTTTDTAPEASDPGWVGTPPTSYFFGTDGTFTLYAWAKNANGVSVGRASPVLTVNAWYGTADALLDIISGLSSIVNTKLPG